MKTKNEDRIAGGTRKVQRWELEKCSAAGAF
jgi:hypothetical protein